MILREVIAAVGGSPSVVENRMETRWRSFSDPHPWYVQSAIAVTIWVGAMFLGGFFLSLVRDDQASQLALGVGMLVAGAILSRSTQGIVRLHLSLVTYAGATSVLFFLCERVSGLGDAETMLLTACTQVVCFLVIAARPVRFKAALGTVLSLWGAAMNADNRGFIDALIVGVALLAALAWLFEARLSAMSLGRSVRPAAFALSLASLWVSAFTFVDLDEARLHFPLVTSGALAVLLVIVALVAARESKASFRSKSVLLAFAGIFGVVALASGSPAILTAVLIIVLGRLRKEPVLEILGITGLLGFCVWLYYGLQVSLLWTAGAMVLAGALLIAARALILGGFLGSMKRSVSDRPFEGSVLSPILARAQPLRIFERRAMLLVPASVVVALVVGLVVQKEHVIREGRPVLLELGPRDPRSFMQGDYVVLRYSDSAAVENLLNNNEVKASYDSVFKIDAQGIGHFDRLDPQGPRSDDEIRIKLKKRAREVSFGATSFFFAEGRGTHWENARYADLRVAADGTTVLVGLRDASLHEM